VNLYQYFHNSTRSRSMICIKTQYFSLNRILLLAIGLWPYHKSKLVQLQEVVFFGILTSFVIFQVCRNRILRYFDKLIIFQVRLYYVPGLYFYLYYYKYAIHTLLLIINAYFFRTCKCQITFNYSIEL